MPPKNYFQETRIFLPNLRHPKQSPEEDDKFLEPADMLKFRELLCVPNLDMSEFKRIMAMSPLNYTEKDVQNDFNFAQHHPFSAESIGDVFLLVYHVFAVIVMLNMLIALMTTVFARG